MLHLQDSSGLSELVTQWHSISQSFNSISQIYILNSSDKQYHEN